MSRRLLVAAACLALALAGCSSAQFEQAHSPVCRLQGVAGSDPVVLFAQAVPTASRLPCIELLPAGWEFGSMFVRNGRARFLLKNDREGGQAVTVILEPSCNTARAVQVPSDEEGTRRYERVDSVRSGFLGERYYLFDGGCVTYRFNLQGEARAAPVNEATLALGFVTRAAVSDTLRRFTDGYFQLDPPSRAAAP